MNKACSSSTCSSSPSLASKNNQCTTTTPLADLTNNLTPLPSLLKLCNSSNPFITNNIPSPVSGDENRNPRSSSFTTPSRRVPPPPTPPPLGEGVSGEHSYSGRRSDVKCKEAIYGLTDSSLVEKDSRKEIRMPCTCPVTIETILDKNLGTVVPSSYLRSSPPAKNKDKVRAIAVIPTRSPPLKKNNDKGKAIAVTPIGPALLKTVNNKGIVFVTPSDETRSKNKAVSSPFDKLRVKDIEIRKPLVTSGSCHLIRDKDKQKGSSMSSRHPIILNDLKGKVKKTAAPSNGLPSETKNKDALLTPLNMCSKKTGHKGKSHAMPSDSQPPFKPNEDLVKEMEMFTCPPLPRTRSKRKRTSKDDVSELPKSWTDPHPKKPKTRRKKKKLINWISCQKNLLKNIKLTLKRLMNLNFQRKKFQMMIWTKNRYKKCETCTM